VSDLASLRLAWEPRILSVLRIGVALLFLEHGTAKIFDFPPQPNPRAFVLMSLVPGLSGLIEAIGGALLTAGLFTRTVAFILSGEMAVAYFMSHAPQSFYPLINRGDSAILYCWIFFYFFVAGGGAWSLDRLFKSEPGGIPVNQSRAAD
jgi:putative oxidoreductase